MRVKWMVGAVLVLSLVALLIYGRFFWPPDPGSSGQVSESGKVEQDSTAGANDGDGQGIVDQDQSVLEFPDQVVVEEVQGFEYQAEESEGLHLVFTDVDVTLTDGETSMTFTIPEPHITVPGDRDTYIYLDLYDLSLHALPASVHRGGVHLATVTSDSEAVEDVAVEEEFIVPASRMGATLHKMEAAESVHVAVLGEGIPGEDENHDELTENEVGEGQHWGDYVFDAALAEEGLTVPNAEQVQVDHYPTYPPSPRVGMVQLGRPSVEDERLEGEQEGSNQLAEGHYDLAILDLGPWFDEHFAAYMENTVRTLRQAGTEVLLLTSNPEASDLPETQENDEHSFLDQQQWLAELAEVWGAEVADTAGYMGAAAGEGLHVTNAYVAGENGLQAVDPPAAGEDPYIRALAVRSVLTERTAAEEADEFELPESTFAVAAELVGDGFPTRAEIQFTPELSAGTVQSSRVSDELANPALRFGQKGAEEDVTVLGVGEMARFSHPHAVGIDFLVESSSAFEADITVGEMDLVIDYVSGEEKEFAQLELVDGIGLSRYADFPNLSQTGIDVRVTSGELRLIGAVFYVKEVGPHEQ